MRGQVKVSIAKAESDLNNNARTINCSGTGTASRKRWTNIAGLTISELLSATNNLTSSPSTNDQILQLETESNWGENYGQFIQGYITAPQTGTYTFWIASDDASEFWLSTDSNPSNKVKRAFVNGWTGSREWTKEPGQKSVTITLTACQQYYFEILHKDYDGGDYLAVGWAKPGQDTNSPSEVVPGSVLSTFSEGGTPLTCNFTISATNSNSTPEPNSSFNLIAACSGADCNGVSYSWSGNGVAGSTQNLSNITAPSSAGNYIYSVTASKVGCAPQISSTTITVGTTTVSCAVNMVKLKFRQVNECCMERLIGAKIQGSNNGGSSWTDIYTFTGNGNGQMTEYSFSNSNVYSSLRFLASSTGWGELGELEFYNGSTKLSGTPFGSPGNNTSDNFDKAFDGDLGTGWHGAAVGNVNYAGLQNISCAGTPPVCTTPVAPSIAVTQGTTVCATTNQQVTLTASGCNGSITWFKDNVQVATGQATYTTSTPGSYTALCANGTCLSVKSAAIIVAQTTGCGSSSDVTPHIAQTGHPDHVNLTITGTKDAWFLTDNSTATKGSDEDWWYVNGGDITITDTPLVNYPYESNYPFTIIKYKVKKGVQETASNDSMIGTFDKNNSLAIYNVTFIFE